MNFPRTFGVVALNWHSDLATPRVLFTPTDSVREIYVRFARGDLAGVLELLSPDIEITETAELPWGGRYRGLRGTRAYFFRLNHHVEAVPELLTYIPAGNDVVVIGKHRGRVRSTGNAFEIDLVHVWTVRDGKMIRCAAYTDAPAMRMVLRIE